ncbi:protein phosphatase 2C domain-containing protein [Actinophytocola oryzae]|uniref:Serine/threonine protein phosphatase PrpC n=1 Tax=Actinophytocola oryzae TaxID=502181 RepID=A0A4R7VNW3_9PSEU|nr:protein phosphatase 2C domain-containing protein [Actinophytocola oryzae]TDV51055.1 serine/threonine protein phosphatase PrpC [Actinophytocola oryzae]
MTVDQTWGDGGVFRPRELGPPSRAAGQPWRLDAVADVPDTVIEAGRVGALEIRAASTRGAAHRARGEVRQDAVGVTDLGGRYVLAAVADGVGDASHAHRGAQLAVRHALGYLTWALPGSDLDVVDMVGAVRAAERAVREAGPAPECRATTLTVAAIELGWAGQGHRYRAVRVGDSPALVLSGGVFLPLFTRRAQVDDRLPSPKGPPDGVRGVLRTGEALVLATSGLGAPVRDMAVGAYLAQAWAEPPGPVAYLHHLQFDLRSFDDDRTAAVIWA